MKWNIKKHLLEMLDNILAFIVLCVIVAGILAVMIALATPECARCGKW